MIYIENINGHIVGADENGAIDYLTGLNGIVKDYKTECAVTFVGLDLQIDLGMYLLNSRRVTITSADIIDVTTGANGGVVISELPGTPTNYKHILKVDTGTKEATQRIEENNYVLIQQNIFSNSLNGIYEVELGILELTSSGIGDYTATIPVVQSDFIQQINTNATNIATNTSNINDLLTRVGALEDLHNDTDWINLTYEPGYQPIVPNHYARYRIRDDILWVQGSVALVAGGSLPSTPFTAVSGIDLTGYFVTGIIQLDSLSINGGSNGSSTYKTTVESDGRVVVAETPSTAATGATKSTYTSLDTIVLLDKEV